MDNVMPPMETSNHSYIQGLTGFGPKFRVSSSLYRLTDHKKTSKLLEGRFSAVSLAHASGEGEVRPFRGMSRGNESHAHLAYGLPSTDATWIRLGGCTRRTASWK
ncbi:hypothetical protein ACFX2I_038037 [Malus domestica]